MDKGQRGQLVGTATQIVIKPYDERTNRQKTFLRNNFQTARREQSSEMFKKKCKLSFKLLFPNLKVCV